MYRRTRFNEELTKEEMERARRAFVGLLQRRGFSWGFIGEEGEEALAIAHTEFTRAIGKGIDVEEPVAWTVNCAWRRTQNLLTAESRRPRSVSTEQLVELADEGEPGPEEILEEAERARKIREAVAELNEAQRQVIALTYFEGMSVREAARWLDWHPSKAQYTHKTAIRSLFEHLGVTSSDQLTVEIGLAAFLTFGAHEGLASLPAGVEAVIDRAGHGATGIWGRLQDAARRFGGGGGDTAGAIASSGAGRAAGVCAAGVAAVCLGTAGVIGGVGIGGGDHGATTRRRPVQARVHHSPRRQAPLPTGAEDQGGTITPAAPSPRGSSSISGTQSSSSTKAEESSTKKERTPAAGISQPRREWRGTDRALVAAESTRAEESASDYAATSSETSSSSSSSSSSSGEEASASETAATKSQFDAFTKAR